MCKDTNCAQRFLFKPLTIGKLRTIIFCTNVIYFIRSTSSETNTAEFFANPILRSCAVHILQTASFFLNSSLASLKRKIVRLLLSIAPNYFLFFLQFSPNIIYSFVSSKCLPCKNSWNNVFQHKYVLNESSLFVVVLQAWNEPKRDITTSR